MESENSDSVGLKLVWLLGGTTKTLRLASPADIGIEFCWMPVDDIAGGYGDLEANIAMAVVGLRSDAQRCGEAEIQLLAMAGS
jgi:hypothetical protein